MPVCRAVVVALFWILCAVVPPAAADEVVLAGGDRYTGAVTGLDGGTLVFDVADFGTLEIPWNAVVRLTVDTPIEVTVGPDGPPVLTALTASGQDGLAMLPGGPVPLSGITALTRPLPALIVTGGANAGFLASTGNTDVASLRLDGDLELRTLRDRYVLRTAFSRASDRGTPTARNWTGSARYNRFVLDRVYLDASAIFSSDRFRDLDLRTALGVGVGYDVLTRGRVALSVEGGYGFVDERFDVAADDHYSALRESARVEVELRGSDLVAFHRQDGYFGVTGTDNLFVNTVTGIRAPLVDDFVATLQYDVDYDRSPAPGRRTTDRSLSLTLGYRF
jgi:putative salt-induced outer membrane protein YdiY